jgi:hypothetical protein
MKNFREHFIKFTEMIRNNEHFGFARYSDGELYILQNKELVIKKKVVYISRRISNIMTQSNIPNHTTD